MPMAWAFTRIRLQGYFPVPQKIRRSYWSTFSFLSPSAHWTEYNYYNNLKSGKMKILQTILMLFAVTFTACNNINKTESNENSVEGTKMEIVLYNDDTGSIFDENKQRICGFELSGGRKGTLSFRTSTDIDFFGSNTHWFYIQGNYAYVEFGDAIRDRTENGIPIKKVEQGNEVHFYLMPNTDRSNTPKTTARKEIKQSESEVPTSTKTWTGASSVDELKTKLVGTIWHCKMSPQYGGYIIKFVFSENSVKKYTADPQEGKWHDGYETFSYSINVERDHDGKNQVMVLLTNDDNRQKGHLEGIAFYDKCTTVVYGLGTNVGGWRTAQNMTYGDFEWSDEL